MTTNRRVFLLTGWGRFLANHLCEYTKRQEYIKSIRDEGSWAVMVAGDYWALQYQRLEFRIRRAAYAFGSYGLSDCASYGRDGWVRWSKERVASANRIAFHEQHRMKAHRAVLRLRELGKGEPVLHPAEAVDNERTSVESRYLELPY